MVSKIEEHGQVLDQFPFSGEASSVLELAIPHYQPFRLQPTQPNLQDFGLHFPNYGNLYLFFFLRVTAAS